MNRNVIHKLLPALLFFMVAGLIACSKKSETDTGGNNNPPAAGPWDGTWKLISTQTERADTTDSTPYTGGIRTTFNETATGSSFTGTLVITKDQISVVSLGYQETTTGQQKEYVSVTGNTTTTPISRMATVGPLTLNSAYTITGDSVTLVQAQAIARVYFGTPSKIRFTLTGNQLTFTSNSYTATVEGTGITRSDRKIRYITTTVYQKQ